MASLVAMPIAATLMRRINPKVVIVTGVLLTAYSTFLMSLFTRSADFIAVLWPRLFMGIGMGFIMVPLFTLTLSHIRKEEMGNATSIFNLARNLGGSCGVAIATTILTRRAQFHQARLVDHLTPFNLQYQWNAHQATELLQRQGLEPSLAPTGGLAVLYEKLLKEASMMSFNDVFYALAVMIILMLPLVLCMKHIRHAPEDPH